MLLFSNAPLPGGITHTQQYEAARMRQIHDAVRCGAIFRDTPLTRRAAPIVMKHMTSLDSLFSLRKQP